MLFYTDGVTESRSADGRLFGVDLLADFLVRATLDDVSAAETVRRLTGHVVDAVGGDLRDDATIATQRRRLPGTAVAGVTPAEETAPRAATARDGLRAGPRSVPSS